MSSKKRRAKRKIALMVRMNQTRERMWDSSIIRVLGGSTPQMRFWQACMMPLGKKLVRMGLKDRAIAALKASGADIGEGGAG